MSKCVFGEFMKYKEGNVFLWGFVLLVGFCFMEVIYDCKEWIVGELKYLLKKMFVFVFDGIIFFSVVLICLLMLFGGVFFFFSIVFGIYVLI